MNKLSWSSPQDSVVAGADQIYNGIAKWKPMANKMDSVAVQQGYPNGRDAVRGAAIDQNRLNTLNTQGYNPSQIDSVNTAKNYMQMGRDKMTNLSQSNNIFTRGINAADVAQHVARRGEFVSKTMAMVNRVEGAKAAAKPAAPGISPAAVQPTQTRGPAVKPQPPQPPVSRPQPQAQAPAARPVPPSPPVSRPAPQAAAPAAAPKAAPAPVVVASK